MATIGAIDMAFLDELFEMRGGYVLDFTDRTFAEFFTDEVGCDIDSAIYASAGRSKGKRLRSFLRLAEPATVAKALASLWEYREAIRVRDRKPESVERATERLRALLDRLGGGPTAVNAGAPPANHSIDPARLNHLKAELLGLYHLAPQARGYAFEKLLRDLFEAHGLDPREPFRLRGEQIDGSFQLLNETYLLEAKWQGEKTGVADLHTFHGKLEQKAAWTRGLFISNSGFSDDGLAAFGRGKRVICMDGLDLHDAMSRGLSLAEILERKTRRAAETGSPFAGVRDLFPS